MSKTVLVVDDDPKFLSTLSSLLKDAGYIVITAKEAKAVNRRLEYPRVQTPVHKTLRHSELVGGAG
jgi:DNA-binding NtrC family response regulator